MVDPLVINASGGAPAYDAAEFRQGLTLPLQYGGRAMGGREGVRPGGTQLEVSLSGSDVLIAPGVCHVDPAWTSAQAGYWVAFPSQLTRGPVGPPDATNPRIDRVWARVYDDDEDSSGQRTADVEYEAGTPAASPSPPAIPQGAIALAQITVPQSGGGSAAVVDEREHTVATGGILIVADDTERDALSDPFAGMAVYRLDIDQIETYDGSTWWPPAHQPGTPVDNSTTIDVSGYSSFTGHSASGTTFVAPPSGVVRIDWYEDLEIDVSSSGLNRQIFASVQVREGGTIGAGTIVDNFAELGSVSIRAESGHHIGMAGSSWRITSGLTPGDTYNVLPGHKMNSTTALNQADAKGRRIMVTGQP